jgi:hypothetical protein
LPYMYIGIVVRPRLRLMAMMLRKSRKTPFKFVHSSGQRSVMKRRERVTCLPTLSSQGTAKYVPEAIHSLIQITPLSYDRRNKQRDLCSLTPL